MGTSGKDGLGDSSTGNHGFDDLDLDMLFDDEDIESDDDADIMDKDFNDVGEASLMTFCKKAGAAFFRQHGLLSHQLNSYNNFVKYGIQKVFDAIGEINIEPGYDPSKKGEGGWRYASVKFGKVVLEPPMFWTGEKFHAAGGEDFIKLLPRHARLQKMTYSARLKVETHFQFGRYQSPEEVPFFPNDLPPCSIPRHNCSQVLPTPAASVTVNPKIWDFYLNQFLPLLAAKGDDGNYALSVSSDLACLQALSRRIHYGKFVAEAKFRNDTAGYSAAIRANDTTTLTNLLTDEKVEEMVKQRVAKKATTFGQDVTLGDTNNSTDLKVDPALASRLYNEWVIPLTKDVEIEYLLRRLD